jgi:hypothetical protein
MSSETILLRDAIDPNRTLPAVDLVTDPSLPAGKGTFDVRKLSIMSEGVKIGQLTLSRDKKGGEAWLNGIEVDQNVTRNGESVRGKGFGMAAYLAAIEMVHSRGETFRTHEWSQSEDAVRIWRQFIEAGIADVIEPFVPYQRGNEHQTQLYSGHVRIQPPSSQV